MITIGIPTYERMTYIRGAIESCLAQTFRDFEIIISDSSTHREIQNLAASYDSKHIRYIRNPSDTRITAKLNNLVKEGRGEWMLILCDDDLLEPEYLEVMMNKARQRPEATLFRSRYKLIDTEGNLLRLDNRTKEYMSPAGFMCRVFLKEKYFFKMNISGIMFPRELLLDLGGFPELDIPWHTDRLTWATLASEGGCVFEKTPLCSIRLHPGSITSSFGASLTSALESDMVSKHIFETLLDKIESRNLNAEDHRYLQKARKNLRKYMVRHLTRSLDHGFITYLSQQSAWGVDQLQSLLQKMRQCKIASFPSLPLYYFLSLMPFSVRGPLLERLKNYKVKKWTS